MATSTFERKIEISDTDALKRLIHIMAADAPEAPISTCPFSTIERKRSEDLLKQFLSHSNH